MITALQKDMDHQKKMNQLTHKRAVELQRKLRALDKGRAFKTLDDMSDRLMELRYRLHTVLLPVRLRKAPSFRSGRMSKDWVEKLLK